MAHAGVEGVPAEDHPPRFQRPPRRLHVLDVQRDLVALHVVLHAHRLRVDHAQRQVARLELRVVAILAVHRAPQAQCLAVELHRRLDVVRR